MNRLRNLIREEVEKVLSEKMTVDPLTQHSTEAASERGEEVKGALTGKKIMASTPGGYYYHGSPVSNLTKESVRLFSKSSDAGHSAGGDRHGLYITSNTNIAADYSTTWLIGFNSPKELKKIGYNIVQEMKEKSLKSEGENFEDDIYGAPYSLVEDFAKKQGFSDSDMYKLRTGENTEWILYSILAAIKKGYWPAMYKIKLRPEDRFIPVLDIDINNDDAVKYTKEGIVGIYSGRLIGENNQDQIAILNRNAIASMEKISDEEFYNSKDMVETGEMWMFARDLLSKI